jgi:hypothetical protein
MQYIYSQFHQKLKREEPLEEPLWQSMIGGIMLGIWMIILPFLLAAFQ